MKHWVWQVGRGLDRKEISTRDVAVETHFYGGPESGVEDAFAAAESVFGATLRALDRGTPPMECSEGLRQLVWTLAIRTRALRSQFAETVEDLLLRLADSASSQEAQVALISEFRAHFDSLLEEPLAKLSLAQRLAVRALLAIPVVRRFVFRLAEQHLSSLDVRALFLETLQDPAVKRRFSDSAKDGQVRGIAAVLERGGAAESFNPAFWVLRDVSPHRLVLGDGCVLAADADGATGSIMRFQSTWTTIYLPISPSKVLIAKRRELDPELSPAALNQAAASLSWSYFYSSSFAEQERELARAIGSGDAVLAEAEMTSVVKDSWAEIVARQGRNVKRHPNLTPWRHEN